MAATAKKIEAEAETAIACPLFGCCDDPNHPACRKCVEVDKSIFDSCQEKSLSKAKTRKTRKSPATGKGRKSDAKLFIQDALGEGCFTRDQIIDGYMIAFPDKARSTVMTYLSDSQNPKYNAFPTLVVVDKTTKIMHYEDRTPNLPDYETVLRYKKAAMDAEKAEKEPEKAEKPKKAPKKKPAGKKKKKK